VCFACVFFCLPFSVFEDVGDAFQKSFQKQKQKEVANLAFGSHMICLVFINIYRTLPPREGLGTCTYHRKAIFTDLKQNKGKLDHMKKGKSNTA
jgi:hypothetical protein